jgi:NAD kinase
MTQSKNVIAVTKNSASRPWDSRQILVSSGIHLEITINRGYREIPSVSCDQADSFAAPE